MFAILIRTVFHECSRSVIVFGKDFMVFDPRKSAVTSKTMKDHKIAKVQINIVTFCEFSQMFMKIEGIYLSIPTNVHGGSWFDSSGLFEVVQYYKLNMNETRFLFFSDL